MQETNVLDLSLKKDKHFYEWTLHVWKDNDVMVEI
jgi:hypothetical protein